ncbi:MAG: PKD domain-containing protein [Chitinophagaceae bacterium]|nr:PKD domain-containing protein [Bacteroidota bacterium]MCC6257484.1 PKD domain-containing protein [Chitinophagaceae bacterium]MCW5917770.1 PKD domain-containing protein [Ferruginibacter sp.]
MSTNNIYTGRIGGLDRKVWYVLGSLIVLIIGIFSFKAITRKNCQPISFSIMAVSGNSSEPFTTNQSLLFKASSEKVKWDFGDKTSFAFGAVVSHQFKQPGDYLVKVSTSLDCFESRKVTIIKPEVNTILPSQTGNEIEGPESTEPKKIETYFCNVISDTYKWEVEEHPEYPRQTNAQASFRFLSPGIYIISVELANKAKYRKQVVVENPSEIPAVIAPPASTTPDTALPSPATESNPKKFITDEVFQNKLQLVVNGEDYKTLGFLENLCGGYTTPTKINGKDPEPFNLACSELGGKKERKWFLGNKKKIKIKSIKLRRNDETHCVELIEVFF